MTILVESIISSAIGGFIGSCLALLLLVTVDRVW